MMRFLNLTRQIGIGANSYVLEIGGRRLVLDGGLHPKREGTEALPDYPLIPDDSVDAVLLSHAHQDHVGAVPVLMRRHPRAPLFASEPTRRIAEIMLHNSVNVMLRMRAERGVSAYPLFTHREVDAQFRRWNTVPLNRRWTLEGERLSPGEESPLSFEFYDAGHILGSVGTLIRSEGRTVFYTGDVNFDDQTLSRGASFPEEPLDVLIVETTRGDRALPPGFTRGAEEQRLAAALAQAFLRGGTVLIPVFALGKTQELLGMLTGMQERGELPPGFPVYIGGLSTRITEMYDELARQWPRRRPELKLLEAISPFVVSGREVDGLPLKAGRVYALTSGMMSENTLSNVFAERLIGQRAHHLFFIGYADPDSPGGRIKAAAPGEGVALEAGGRETPLRAHVEDFNFSAHASRESLRAWIGRVRPKKVLLVHGDQPAIDWFRTTLEADLPGSEIRAPEPGEWITL